jgi:hypothetical protein
VYNAGVRVFALVPIALISLGSVARADTSVAVVFSGNDSIKRQTTEVVEAWFTFHQLPITSSPLSKDGMTTLTNCLVISDMACARGVVEARATVDNIIAVTGQVSGKRETRTVQLAAYWISKQHEVVSVQRTCDTCSDTVLATTLDAMVDDLAAHAPTMNGKVHVTTVPAGLAVAVDNDKPVTTPLDRDISFGSHVIAVMRDGRVVASKKIEIAPLKSIDVPITVPDEKTTTRIKIVEGRGSRTVPLVLMTVGVAASVTGIVLYATGGPTGESYTYRNLRPAGIATGISGVAAAAIGVVWLVRGGKASSRPEVAITSTAATVGWARSF